MNARREPANDNRWLYLFCSLVVLLLSWAVRPEAAREWLASQIAVLRSTDGKSSGATGFTTTSEGALVATTGAARGPDSGRKITLYLPSRAVPGMLDAVEANIGMAESPKELAVEAVNLLQSTVQESGRRAALPAGTRLLAIFTEGNKVTIDLSAEFISSAPSSVAEARVALYALVNTITSLPFADEVRILVGDEERTSYFDCFDLTAGYRFNPDVVAQRSATGKSH